MVYSSNCSIPEIGKVIEHDPALATNALKIVNSALFGMRYRISDVSKALVILGIREIVNLVSGIVVFRMFKRPNEQVTFNRKSLWLHSAGCAVLSRTIAKTAGINVSGEEFISGLLHDVGKILLDQYFHEGFVSAVKMADETRIPLYEAEKRVLGMTHQDVGGWIGRHWNLPDNITEAVEMHHAPEEAQNPVLASIVHTANLLCKVCSIGYSGYAYGYSLSDDKGWQILRQHSAQLTEINIDHFTREVNVEIRKARDFLRISESA
jgi:HD-like signal output (HDOD) protein